MEIFLRENETEQKVIHAYDNNGGGMVGGGRRQGRRRGAVWQEMKARARDERSSIRPRREREVR